MSVLWAVVVFVVFGALALAMTALAVKQWRAANDGTDRLLTGQMVVPIALAVGVAVAGLSMILFG
ncbi:MAG: hypothetical protein S0880_04920 [Actinomycetota bacterium]|nr:hypothetical protein [Actinomycetota bacterium]